MHMIAPIVGVTPDKYVLRTKGLRSSVLHMEHPSGDNLALVFDTEKDAKDYYVDHGLEATLPDLEVAPVRDWLRPIDEKFCLVWDTDVKPEEDLWLTCPTCLATRTTVGFEELPEGRIRCRHCGEAKNAEAFAPRLIKRTPGNDLTEPKPTEFRIRLAPDKYTTYVTEPLRVGDETSETPHWVLTHDGGWNFMSMTDADGATWPLAFKSPVDLLMFKKAFWGLGSMPKARPALTALNDRLDPGYVQVVRQSYRACPTCGNLCEVQDGKANPVCPKCGLI